MGLAAGAAGQQLQLAHPQEGGRHTGGGNPEGVHELLGQELAHAGAEHGAAIGSAAVGRGPTTNQNHSGDPLYVHQEMRTF